LYYGAANTCIVIATAQLTGGLELMLVDYTNQAPGCRHHIR